MKKILRGIRGIFPPAIVRILDAVAPIASFLCLALIGVTMDAHLPLSILALMSVVVIGTATFIYTLAYVFSDDVIAPLWWG